MKDANEYIDDAILDRKIKLDGENLKIYLELKAWGESFEKSGFIVQFHYDEIKKIISVSVQELKKQNAKYLIASYNIKTKELKIQYFIYNEDDEEMQLKSKDYVSSPSNLNNLLDKYKNIIMNKNKQQITEATKEKKYTPEQIDDMLSKCASLVGKLKDIVTQEGLQNTPLFKSLKTIYQNLRDTPSLQTLKTKDLMAKKNAEEERVKKLQAAIPRPVSEDIKVSANAAQTTIKKAQDIAEKHKKDVRIVDESAKLTVGKLKSLIKESMGEQEVLVTDRREIINFVNKHNLVDKDSILEYRYGYYDGSRPNDEVAGVYEYDHDGENGSFRYVYKINGNYVLRMPSNRKYISNPDALREAFSKKKK